MGNENVNVGDDQKEIPIPKKKKTGWGKWYLTKTVYPKLSEQLFPNKRPPSYVNLTKI